ncbi:hypothetical protein QOT17_006371 [Balamuthia mandrillaris]
MTEVYLNPPALPGSTAPRLSWPLTPAFARSVTFKSLSPAKPSSALRCAQSTSWWSSVWSDAANTLFTPNAHPRLTAAPVPNSLLSRAKRLGSTSQHAGTDQDPRFWDN